MPACDACASSRETLLRCSTCKVVTYCDRLCQKVDWKHHKHWCRAVLAASACEKCIHIAGKVQAVPIHTSLVENRAIATRLGEDPRIVLVAHAPYRSQTDMLLVHSINAEAKPAGREGVNHKCEIIVQKQEILCYGQWGLLKDGLVKAFAVENDDTEELSCCICFEPRRCLAACRVCHALLCDKCERLSVLACGGPRKMRCPVCRTPNIPEPESTCRASI